MHREKKLPPQKAAKTWLAATRTHKEFARRHKGTAGLRERGTGNRTDKAQRHEGTEAQRHRGEKGSLRDARDGVVIAAI